MFSWIKDLFSKQEYESHGTPGRKPVAYRWAVIIPHTKKAQGAHSIAYNITEYMYALRMMMSLDRSFETRDRAGVYGAALALRKKGFNCSLEPHLNAYNSKAKGFEVLCMKDDEISYDVAELIAQRFHEQYPDRKLRHGNGVKLIEKGQRGYENLRQAKRAGMDVALLSEAFFIDNPEEWIEPKDMANFWASII